MPVPELYQLGLTGCHLYKAILQYYLSQVVHLCFFAFAVPCTIQ